MADYNKPLSGGIYVASADVTNASANQVADFEGDAGATVTKAEVTWTGQSLFVQDAAATSYAFAMSFSTIAFKPETVGTVFGITATSGSTKEASPVTATIYEFSTSLADVPALEWLVHWTRSSDSKKAQLWAGAGKLTGDFPMMMSRDVYMAHDSAVICYPDADNKILQVIKEV